MKRGINILVGAVVLVLALCFAVKSLFNINIKNPFTGKTEVPESVVAENIPNMVDDIGYKYMHDEPVPYTWKMTHHPDRERHQDVVDVDLIYTGDFGSITYRQTQTYQYYKDNDIWMDEDREEVFIQDVQWDYDSIYAEINNKTFVSRREDSKWGDDYESSITFSDLDLESRTVTVTYRIDDLDYGDLSFIRDVNTLERLESISGSKVGSIEYIEERGYFEVTVYASCRLQYNGGNNALNIGFTLRPTEFSFFPSW